MIPSDHPPRPFHGPILTEDQRDACDRLLRLAQVRTSTTEAALPTRLLARWSVPLVVGPAGSGKEFACQDVARRLGGGPCRRWEVGSWITLTNRTSGTTLEQIERFTDAHPQGCIVYLAGIDTLGAAVEDRNLGYRQACVSEIEQLLDQTASRPPRFLRRDGTTWQTDVLVIVGGRFATLWGDRELGTPSGADAWRNADHEPLADARAVGSWLVDHSGLPAGIQRRLAPEPLVLRHLGEEEAGRLAVRLCRSLPPALDGIAVGELSEALRGTGGWQTVAHVIEQALASGYEDLPVPDHPDAEDQSLSYTPPVDPPELPPPPPPPTAGAIRPLMSAKSTQKGRPPRLADRLRLASHRSRLLPKARRLGLTSVTHLEALAVVRGYTLPGGDDSAPPIYAVGAWQHELSDVELAVALLSPGLDYRERAVCRGALMLLRLSRVTEPYWIARAARKERAYTVVRHVVLLGARCYPQEAHWPRLLETLPRIMADYPPLPPGALPDEAILHVLTSVGA